MNNDNDRDDSVLTPERMQEQCATVADALEKHLDHAVADARQKAKKTWLPWRRNSHLEFANAALFASAIAKTVAMVIRAMPSDHPVEVALSGLSTNFGHGTSTTNADDLPKVSTKPKGVTLQ